jgi:methenyltetrahydrofolate cyclohydrolase
LPKTRHGSEQDRSALAAARGRLERLADDLLALVDEDTAAYDRVLAAFRLPKAGDEDEAARRAAIQVALAGAIGTPMRVMARAGEALDLAATVARHGNPSATSDLQVGVALLSAALEGGRLNVEVNLASLKDEAAAARLRAELERLRQAAGGAVDRLPGALQGG